MPRIRHCATTGVGFRAAKARPFAKVTLFLPSAYPLLDQIRADSRLEQTRVIVTTYEPAVEIYDARSSVPTLLAYLPIDRDDGVYSVGASGSM